jgi:hypothetical protein
LDVYIGILLEAYPILHISRIRVKVKSQSHFVVEDRYEKTKGDRERIFLFNA